MTGKPLAQHPPQARPAEARPTPEQRAQALARFKARIGKPAPSASNSQLAASNSGKTAQAADTGNSQLPRQKPSRSARIDTMTDLEWLQWWEANNPGKPLPEGTAPSLARPAPNAPLGAKPPAPQMATTRPQNWNTPAGRLIARAWGEISGGVGYIPYAPLSAQPGPLQAQWRAFIASGGQVAPSAPPQAEEVA